MNTKELLTLAQSDWQASSTWYKAAAWQAIDKGWYRVIDSPNDPDIYLLRCWLTAPSVKADGELDSQNSVLLHRFFRPDSDRALHSHPWAWFRTTVLSGGYLEQLPPKNWRKGSVKGPRIGLNAQWRNIGDTVIHQGSDLHCDTWTLFVTGPTVGPWGFHAFNKPWVESNTYLAELAELTHG